MKIQDSVFLITGGSSGLGAATALAALQAGARVVIADLREPSADSPLAGHANAVFVTTDVSNADSAQKAVDTAVNRFGRLDVLVNAAGIGPAEKIHGKNGPHRLDSFARTLEVNLTGSFNMMRLAVPAMIDSGPSTDDANDKSASQGVIVNTASVAAFDGQIGQCAYAASKGGIVAMTLPAARELARDRIRVLTIAPGLFLTPLLANLPQEAQDSLAAAIPFPRRLGQADEFAALALHMVENAYLNGEVVRLDGSLRMAPK